VRNKCAVPNPALASMPPTVRGTAASRFTRSGSSNSAPLGTVAAMDPLEIERTETLRREELARLEIELTW
jgi:hypothetical protein